MIGKLLVAAILFIGIFFGVEIGRFYVPENFENRILFKIASFYTAIACQLARAANKLGFGHEGTIIRFMSDLFLTPNYIDADVKINDVVIDDVKARVYRPKSMKSASLPIMVFYHGGGYFFSNICRYRKSPEHPYPRPTEDCYVVTKHVIENPSEYSADILRLVLAGDSAGGNAVAVVTQRLLKENMKMPKLQVLIYPWVQMIDFSLPSHRFYDDKNLGGRYRTSFNRAALWYLGVTNASQEVEDIFMRNELYSLVEDEAERIRIVECLDISKIPADYKPIDYYNNNKHHHDKLRSIKSDLAVHSVLRRDKQMAETLKKFLHPSVSPLIAHRQDLVGLPKAYFITLEWDSLKDESILYAQRLKEAGVDVEIAFYEGAYHGIAPLLNKYQIARNILNDLVQFLSRNL